MMLNKILLMATMVLFSISCAKKPDESALAITKALYVASGLCSSGATNTAFTAATAGNIIYTVDLTTGNPTIVSDYNTSIASAGDTPTGLVNFDGDNLLASVENATSPAYRRLEKVPKKGGVRLPYFGNATTLSSALRGISRDFNGNILITRTTGVEKLNATPARQTIGAATSWLTALAGSCTNSATFISSVVTTNTGKIIYTHANALQNKVGVVKSTGYSVVGDCITANAAAVATAYPTASLYIAASNKLLVLWAGTTAQSNNYVSIYDFDETTGLLTNETVAFQDTNVIYGGSAMTYDSDENIVYIATANGTSTTVANYNIEKFSLDTTTRLLTRVGTTPFATGWYGSKCVSSMYIGN
jgi:hypothetical protein